MTTIILSIALVIESFLVIVAFYLGYKLGKTGEIPGIELPDFRRGEAFLDEDVDEIQEK